MKRILSSFIIIGIVAALVVSISRAYFSDTESSSGNTFTAGSVDLKIDNQSYYNGIFSQRTSWDPTDLVNELFFDFTDLKPSDWGEDTISLRVDTNDAWLCADISVTSDDDNDCTEPELGDDPNCTENGDLFDGEVGSLVNMVFWVDDGDNVLETDEVGSIFEDGTALDTLTDKTWALAHSSQIGRILLDSDLNEGAMRGGQTYYIGKYWCFGNLTQDPVPEGQGVDPTVDSGFDCDGSGLDNAAQTDSLLADISFRAEQARNNPDFVCEKCLEEVFADSVFAADQGDRKDGSDVLAIRSDSSNALGAPDSAPINLANPKWFSLGFRGSIIIKFGSQVEDGAGDDLSIHEVTGGRSSYPLETAEIAVSQDGTNWFVLAEQATSQKNESGPGVTLLEISATGLPWIQYVRVTDTTNPNIHSNNADGFDLDAINAVNGECVVDI